MGTPIFTPFRLNYRYSSQAPLPAPVHDAARAIQHLRSRAAELGIDKTRFAVLGGSAGGCTSLWLATHDDLADPKKKGIHSSRFGVIFKKRADEVGAPCYLDIRKNPELYPKAPELFAFLFDVHKVDTADKKPGK